MWVVSSSLNADLLPFTFIFAILLHVFMFHNFNIGKLINEIFHFMFLNYIFIFSVFLIFFVFLICFSFILS